MKIYLAGCPAYTNKIEHRLLSFWDNPNEISGYKSLFLDSGAFSAWSKQSDPINIDNYMKYINDNKEHIDIYANLDVIGDVKKSWKNQKILESNGFTPLPVFHAGDSDKYLKKCVDNYEYFCIGGMARRFNTMTRIAFLDSCFSMINTNGNKVHGFGATATNLLLRYPWYSVDSASWVLTAATGSIMLPRLRKFEHDYTYLDSVHFDNVNGLDLTESIYKNRVLEYIENKELPMGRSFRRKKPIEYILKENEKVFGPIEENIIETKKVVGITNDFYMRAAMNVEYYQDLERYLKTLQTKAIKIQGTFF